MKRYFLFCLFAVLVLAACGGSDGRGEATSADIPPTPPADSLTNEENLPPPEKEGETPESSSVELTKIRLPMGYIADPQYAPFYVAVEKGYFAQEGFELVFDYSFETDGVQLVGNGDLPFAVVSGEQVIMARAQEIPVVYVLEWFQKFPIAVVSRADAGIEIPADLIGHSVGIPGFFGASYVGYVGLLSANNIQESDVNTSEIGFSQIEAFLTDQVDAVIGYSNNEPVQLAAQGEAINVIQVADYVDMVANGIITNETCMAENPNQVEGFVRAFLHGLSDTLADPAAAYEISKKYVEGLDDSRMNVLDASLELWQADMPGVTDPASWEQTQDVLLQINF
ncbi:MAG: ABC transporter substrate-binding protein, partial [Candidatus Promineifilaceae bacterium]